LHLLLPGEAPGDHAFPEIRLFNPALNADLAVVCPDKPLIS
jgi:hypothetical protein